MAKPEFKGFDGHGNEKRNPNPYHLYEIKDKVDESVYKYGISADPIDDDGYSYRMRRQIKVGNSFVGWLRFYGNILLKNIAGRERAEVIEDEYVDRYEERTGKRPRGNF